jgi:hypothetical protein
MHDTRTKRKNIKNSENLRDIVPSIAQHCPALPSIAQPFCFQLWSRVTFTKAQALVLCCNCQFLLHRATWCHGAFHPVRKGEMQTATQPLNPLSHV